MNKKSLIVLIACEESQAECEAFRNLGHKAFSCDVQSCRQNGHPEWHIKGDVTPLLSGETKFTTQDGKRHRVKKWDLIIAHPPCTYLCKLSSVQLRKNADSVVLVNGKEEFVNAERYKKMIAGRRFFYTCLNAKSDYLAVENPIPMRMTRLPPPNAYACPSWFGVKYTKKTCYWLKNLPPLYAELEYPNPKCYVTASRGKYRSRTFPQLAQAIAKQWSEFIIEDMKQKKRKQKL